jgi:hypothetical protein
MLSEAQLATLRDQEVRRRLPTKASDFVYADRLIKDVGPTCSRLPAVYDRIFSGLSPDLARWIALRHPASPTKTGPAAPVPVERRPVNIVNRSISVLQSYKKAP